MNKHRILCRANRLEGGEVHALLVLHNLNERSTEGKVQQTTLVEQEPQDRAPVIPTGAGGHSSPSQRRCCLKANQAAASASLGEPGLPWMDHSRHSNSEYTTATNEDRSPSFEEVQYMQTASWRKAFIFSSSMGRAHI